jgi:hypothetical protein
MIDLEGTSGLGKVTPTSTLPSKKAASAASIPPSTCLLEA